MTETPIVPERKLVWTHERFPPALRATILDDVCTWVSQGKTLRDFCRQEGMPTFWTVYEWLAADESINRRFVRARETGYDVIAMECLEIADTAGEDESNPQVRRAALRIDTRLKLLARWDPKRYGDRQQVEHTGGVSLAVVTGVPVRPADPDVKALPGSGSSGSGGSDSGA